MQKAACRKRGATCQPRTDRAGVARRHKLPALRSTRPPESKGLERTGLQKDAQTADGHVKTLHIPRRQEPQGDTPSHPRGWLLATRQAAGPPDPPCAAVGPAQWEAPQECSELHVTAQAYIWVLAPKNWKPGPQETHARPCSLRYSPEPRHGSNHGGPDDRADKHAASHVVGQYPIPEGENKLALAVTGMDLEDTVVGEMSQPQHKQHATHSREGPRPVRPTGTGRRRWVPGAWGRVVAGNRVSVWKAGKFWRRTAVVAAGACECSQRSTRSVPLPPRVNPRESSVKVPRPAPSQECPGARTAAAARGKSELSNQPWESEPSRARGSSWTAGSDTRAPSAPEAWGLPPTLLQEGDTALSPRPHEEDGRHGTKDSSLKRRLSKAWRLFHHDKDF